MKIYQVTTYVDGNRREVKECVEKTDSTDRYLSGSAMLIFRSNNPNTPNVPQQFDFVFPKEIATVEEAFEKFDAELKVQLDKQREEYQKMLLEKGKKIIVPGM